MGEQIYNLLNSSVFQVTAIIWFIILVLWTGKWMGLLTRSVNLLKKPVIFTKDSNPENVLTYPREFLEESSTSFRNALTQPLTNVTKAFHELLGKMFGLVYDHLHPFRTIGYVVLFACFLMLIYADAVAVANTLLALEISTEINPFLTNFDFAVFAGSLIALILGIAFVFETMSSNAEFTPMSDRDPRIRNALFALALLISLLSAISLVAWGLARIGVVEGSNSIFLDRFVNIVVLFVIPLNSALTASMIFNESFRGLLFVIVFTGYILEGFFHILNYILTLLSSLLPFVFDVLYRLAHIIVDFVLWAITTPIFAIFLPFKWLFEFVNSGSQLPPNKLKEDAFAQKNNKDS